MIPVTGVLIALGALYLLTRGGGKGAAARPQPPRNYVLSDRLREAGSEAAQGTIDFAGKTLGETIGGLFAPSSGPAKTELAPSDPFKPDIAGLFEGT